MRIIVALDGHSSCGKSTMAKWLAREIGYVYVDTGAMYRAVTLFALRNGFFSENPDSNQEKLVLNAEALEAAMPQCEVSFRLDPTTSLPRTLLCGEDVEDEIRGMKVSAHVSPIAALPFVRTAMTRQQQAMGEQKGIVMDGRDIGTVVFPQAELKIFVTARAEVRAQRRYDELIAKGMPATYEEILQNVQERDYIDSHRAVAPLRPAEGALILDNSEMTREQQNQWLLDKFQEALNTKQHSTLNTPHSTLHTALEQEIQQLRAQTLSGLYEPIAYALGAGGKRLRPTLLLSCYALYRDDVERAVPAAVGLEMYHNHTLLHDDVMDHADVRRGRPTVHKKWDENTAILSGDAMLLRATQIIAEASPALVPLFLRTAIEICEGQQMDVDFESRTDVRPDEYLEMIRLKTSVLLACACQMGGLLAQAPADDVQALYDFGEALGLAFQIQDDLLDTFGDPATFGKAIGGDILCGKKTWLLTTLLSLPDGATQHSTLEILARPAHTETEKNEKIAAMQQLYRAHHIPEAAEAAIAAHLQRAAEALQRLSCPQKKQEALQEIIKKLEKRKK